ncbi:MAG: kelch repeat-containing protein [Chitinophagaceae bacterium]
MKNIVTPFILLCSLVSTAQITQNSQWTWMKGSTEYVPRAFGQYGIKGVAAATNTPGARDRSCSWKDNTGNFWVFGGIGFATEGQNSWGYLNDLWKYDPATNIWTWMKGDSTLESFGVYGAKGVAGVTNKPGGRSRSASWKDGAGNLWLFGGDGRGAINSGNLNDLWKYNPSTNIWTWMKGDSTANAGPIYGTQGIEADSVKPPASFGSVSWADGGGYLWLCGRSSDLWKYNPATNRWAWVKGKVTLNPRYGTQGVPDSANTPGDRFSSASWIDSAGNMWLFGSSDRGDLWKYNPVINQWAWIKGDTTLRAYAISGTMGISAPANHPGSRIGTVCWKDNLGKFWLYGGTVYVGTTFIFSQTAGDLWKYDPSNNQWAWMGLQANPGVYGVQGTAAATNKPPRKSYAVSWIDGSGMPWIFGGTRTDFNLYGNELWKLGNVTGPINTHLCNGNPGYPAPNYTLTAADTGSSYQWQENTGSGFVNLSGVNTNSLSLSNVPSSSYGYQYRCLVNGVVNSNLFKLAFNATWTGGTGGAWENAANWSCGVVPDANTDVIINANAGSPVINYSTSCRSVFLKPATLLTVKSGVALKLTGK